MFVGIGNGSWSFIALPGCIGVSGPGTDGAECVDGLVHVVVDCNGTGMDKPRVAGGNGAGSKGVSIGGPGVANGTKDVVEVDHLVESLLSVLASHASVELGTRTTPYHQAAGR